jgi:hypothetical protein
MLFPESELPGQQRGPAKAPKINRPLFRVPIPRFRASAPKPPPPRATSAHSPAPSSPPPSGPSASPGPPRSAQPGSGKKSRQSPTKDSSGKPPRSTRPCPPACRPNPQARLEPPRTTKSLPSLRCFTQKLQPVLPAPGRTFPSLTGLDSQLTLDRASHRHGVLWTHAIESLRTKTSQLARRKMARGHRARGFPKGALLRPSLAFEPA